VESGYCKISQRRKLVRLVLRMKRRDRRRSEILLALAKELRPGRWLITQGGTMLRQLLTLRLSDIRRDDQGEDPDDRSCYSLCMSRQPKHLRARLTQQVTHRLPVTGSAIRSITFDASGR
jgi:hypothetical protein